MLYRRYVRFQMRRAHHNDDGRAPLLAAYSEIQARRREQNLF